MKKNLCWLAILCSFGVLAKEPGRFDVREAVVIDTTTHLMWQRCNLSQVWGNNTCSGQQQTFTWQEATNEAERNTLAGYDDWSLPTQEELLSLIDNELIRPTIDTAIFPNSETALYWSSSDFNPERSTRATVNYLRQLRRP